MTAAAARSLQADVPASMLAALTAATDQQDQPVATLRLLDRLLDDLVGHRLFTALLYRPALGMAVRLYSSRPEIYSAAGAKSLDDAPTMKAVLMSGKPYIGKTSADIERDFPDHEKIFALGCGSVMNMPVCWLGEVFGQINILNRSGHFHEGHLSVVERLAQSVAPVFVAAAARTPESSR